MSEDLDDLTIEFDVQNELPLQQTNTKKELVFSEIKRTLPVMTLAEKVNVISARIRQLNLGYKSSIEDILEKENIIRSYDIAMKEFELGKIPTYYIKRVLPNGTYELWSHNDFSLYP